eukprot:CAMPEP_0201900140 /NCGR_PEP_ID=MMETSP0902-20130614/51744_1 /ASSEMBLY_ACC=CAM_ASM_000551 /TAXON_ID=420261 /ORGANISM="Thalassiosira antarctica, Strain CCMP982" /LENGTH=467 /DNA_ID=CAMNT_0048433719 /DNA_START=70 /DNA_END=1473 /DNA_ORIENTATION=-
MKTWTKNNMKLLSKLRASKRERAAGDEQPQSSISMQRQSTPRELAVLEEAGSPEADEPMSPMACCSSTPNRPITPPTTDGTSGVNIIVGTTAKTNSARTSDYYPFDEASKNAAYDSAQNGKQPTQQDDQQQQSIFKELFIHFRRRSWKKKLLTFLVVLTITPVFFDVFILQTGYVTGFIDIFLEWMAEHPLLGVWAYILMLVLTSLIFVPPSILIFAAGFTFQSLWGSSGIMIALVSSFLGSMMGGLIGFWRANYMTRDLIEVLMRRYPLIKAVDAAIVRNSLRVMLLMRLNCLIPFGVLNYVFGITGVNWAEFLLAMAGIIPWHLLLIFLGASAETMYDESVKPTLMGVILMAMGIASGIIGLAITWKFAKKELQKEVEYAPKTATADGYRFADQDLRPWRSESRNTPVPNIEDADLYATDYFYTQCLGDDRHKNTPVTVDYGTEVEEEDYRTKLNWNEILLDDFS